MTHTALTPAQLLEHIDEDTIRKYRLEAKGGTLTTGLHHYVALSADLSDLEVRDGAYEIKNRKFSLTLYRQTTHQHLLVK